MTALSQPGRVMPSCGWAAMCGSSGLRWKAGSRDAGDLGGRLRFEPIECGREMLVVGRCRFERRQWGWHRLTGRVGWLRESARPSVRASVTSPRSSTTPCGLR